MWRFIITKKPDLMGLAFLLYNGLVRGYPAGIGSSSIVKSMGSRHCTFTASLFLIPGFHFDIRLSTRTASLSSSSCRPCTTSMLEMVPSADTMNEHSTRPCMPC